MNTLPSYVVALFLISLVQFSSIDTARAQEPQPFADIQRILDAGVLRVAVLAKDAPPMIMTDPQDGLTGSEPDLARDMAQKLGVDVVFVRRADTYDGVVDMIARKEADIAVSYLTGGVQRALYVLFSQPYIQQSGRLFFNRAQFAQLRRDYGIDNLTTLNTLPPAAKVVVGVESGSVYQTILKRDLPGVKVKAFDDLPEIVNAVKDGAIFAGIHGSLQTHYFIRSHPATAIYVAVDSDVRLPSDIRIAVRSDSPNLLRWIDIYLSNHVGMLSHAEILDSYLADRQK